jgi:hypothetical protein
LKLGKLKRSIVKIFEVSKEGLDSLLGVGTQNEHSIACVVLKFLLRLGLGLGLGNTLNRNFKTTYKL